MIYNFYLNPAMQKEFSVATGNAAFFSRRFAIARLFAFVKDKFHLMSFYNIITRIK